MKLCFFFLRDPNTKTKKVLRAAHWDDFDPAEKTCYGSHILKRNHMQEQMCSGNIVVAVDVVVVVVAVAADMVVVVFQLPVLSPLFIDLLAPSACV